MAEKIFPLNIPPGIQRDGTQLAARAWTDGLWTRFQRSLPQKIGGYSQITNTNELVRGVYVLPNSPNFNVYYGASSYLKYVTINEFGAMIGGPVDRTPIPFTTSIYNDWQFDTMFDTVSDANTLIAHPAPNLASLDNTIETPIFYGPTSATTPLIPTGHSVSGGIVCLQPYLVMFGNDGGVKISNVNDPTTILLDARVTSKKVVAGLATRGGQLSPAGLLWSLDSLIRMTFVGGNDLFNFDTVIGQSSILSSRGIIEYDGIFYWAAIDRFLMYNGVVQEVPNQTNLNFFFRNVNLSQRQKVWATKITQYGEIWWHFPAGAATECNYSVCYNVRDQCWYDTAITRSDGYFDSIFGFPIWADNVVDVSGNYPLWIQEFGRDKVDLAGNPTAVHSYVTTPFLGWPTVGVDANRNSIDLWTGLNYVDPDFIQDGPMTLTVNCKEYANSDATNSTFNPYSFTNTTNRIFTREQGRLMTLTFDSNVIGGYYEMGQVLVAGRFGDSRA